MSTIWSIILNNLKLLSMEDYKHHWQVVNRGQVVAINSPEDLWFIACAYFKWCDEHPLQGTIRPYNIKGLCLHGGFSEEYLKDLRNMKDRDSLWWHVVARIVYVIHLQNIELATIGSYNAVFISKLYKMDTEEPQEGAIKIEMVTNVPKLSASENEILTKMNLENDILGNAKS